jgi:hypothetical protein
MDTVQALVIPHYTHNVARLVVSILRGLGLILTVTCYRYYAFHCRSIPAYSDYHPEIRQDLPWLQP